MGKKAGKRELHTNKSLRAKTLHPHTYTHRQRQILVSEEGMKAMGRSSVRGSVPTAGAASSTGSVEGSSADAVKAVVHVRPGVLDVVDVLLMCLFCCC